MTIGLRIKSAREAKKITQEELGAACGTTKQSIFKYETGIVTNIPLDRLEKIAETLDVTPAYLMGWEEESKPSVQNNTIYSHFPTPEITDDTVTFPVIGEVAAGYEHIAAENWDGDTVKIPSEYLKGHSRGEFFVLTVHGDSMYPIFIEGDKVLVLKQTTLNKSGDIGVIIYDDEIATLKKVEFVMGEDWLTMIPINPNHPPKRIEGADLERCRVIGVPKLIIREWNS